MTTETHYKVAGCRIHCLQSGTGGKDVLLLHGASFQAATWDELGTLGTISREGYRATGLDLPGHGESPSCPVSKTRVLDAGIQELGLERPVLIGPSMGGEVALDFALEHPDRVQALVLIGPVGVEKMQDRLATLQLPVLIIWGENDEIAPLEHGRLLQEKIQGARLVVFEEAPHPAYLEKTDRWHRELLDFLKGLE
ncbi:MAG: alpha/beta fold hydrolase [Desulfohalobiaceae bacterium]